ncbi:MAG: hypothetical protein WBD16_10720 [Pyrinomonadaceae bacterium]
MPSGELFESQSRRSIDFKLIAIGAIALVLLCGGAYALFLYNSPTKMTAEQILAQDIRDNTVILLDYSRFTGDEFREQILGKGRLETFNRRDKDAYFTYPESEEQEFNQFVAKFFYNPERLEFAKEKDGRMELGNYKLSSYAGKTRLFRTKLDNIKIAANQSVNFPYQNVNYTASLGELLNLTNNSQVYGGKMMTQASTRRDEPQYVFANHGIMVARPSEPSLKRLSDELLKDTGAEREVRIQQLVDFVANEIEYSFAEALGGQETLKRPNETLMTRNGDCSNKSILLASLLEQIGEEYILLYCPQHITVAVPQGAFVNDNKLDFTWNQKPWVIAETTVPGFQIGKSKLTEPDRLNSVEYVQDPKLPDVIFDASSYAVLKFL